MRILEFWPPEWPDLLRQRQGRVLKPAWGNARAMPQADIKRAFGPELTAMPQSLGTGSPAISLSPTFNQTSSCCGRALTTPTRFGRPNTGIHPESGDTGRDWLSHYFERFLNRNRGPKLLL